MLGRAMELFWLRGYERLGLAELLEHMGISRQSLYDTFGNKRGLFVRAIQRYRATQLSRALALLERDGSPVANVRDALGFFEELALDESGRGCLVVNALVEVTGDEELTNLLCTTLELLRAGIERALHEAQKCGELSEEKAPLELSRTLMNAMLGLAVTGRLRPEPAAVRDVSVGTLALLT